MAEDVGCLGFHGAGWVMVGEVEKNGATTTGECAEDGFLLAILGEPTGLQYG